MFHLYDFLIYCFITANTFREDQVKAREIGMDGFIAKPIDVNKLMQKLGLGKRGEKR